MSRSLAATDDDGATSTEESPRAGKRTRQPGSSENAKALFPGGTASGGDGGSGDEASTSADAMDEDGGRTPQSPSKKLKEDADASSGASGVDNEDGETDSSSSSSVDSYYDAPEDGDEKGDSAWEDLQVSIEDLGRLQRALYERGTSPALVALVTFGMRTTPFQKPSKLLAAVREKLNSHDELWNELRRYREALEPRTPCPGQVGDRSGSGKGSGGRSESMYVDDLGSSVVPGGHPMASDVSSNATSAESSSAGAAARAGGGGGALYVTYPANYFSSGGAPSRTGPARSRRTARAAPTRRRSRRTSRSRARRA